MKPDTYRQYLLVLLLLVLTASHMDRLVLSLVLQDIKVELQLSDSQLGVLSGIAFAIFYALIGLPIARRADRGNRVTILAATTGLFGAAVALCGMVMSFAQLLFLRVLTAVGESGTHPTALSLISDHFNRADRPRAIARYWLGLPVAMICGYLVAGWLNRFFGWRMTFLLIALPSIALAILMRFSLREPRLTSVRAGAEEQLPPAANLRETLTALWKNPAYLHLLICLSLESFFVLGVLLWQPSFFVRTHGLDTGTLGTWLGLVSGVTGFFGVWLGGELASRWAAADECRQLVGVAWTFVLLACVKPLVYLVSQYQVAFALLAVVSLLAAITKGPLYAATQTAVPPRMRATSFAIILFFAQLIGMGLGPLAVGVLSDALRPAFGDDTLRYILAALSPGYLFVALQVWLASRRLRPAETDSATTEKVPV